ncbi:MAG: hypothetical protein DMG41_24830 [Acidobacteria bacterium]|nr:MAG: hypothetical protein DMG41_24830 [Acidobacteriota bacterium]
MKNVIRATLLVATLLVLARASEAQVSVGIVIGAPPPPRAVAVLPPSPAREHVWVAGYWYPVGRHYKWHEGYWTRPPYEGARWIPPRHDGERYYGGYWEGDRGRVEHDHHWDRGRDRDFRDHDRHDERHFDHDHRRNDR